MITKDNFIAEKQICPETIFNLPFFSPTQGAQLYNISQAMGNGYSVHHDHIWAVLQGIE